MREIDRELVFCISINDIEGTRSCLAQGANINIIDRVGSAPLHYAVTSCHTDMVKLLLEQEGIDVNIREYHNHTSLHIAVACGFLSIVELLLKKEGIDVNIRDKNGETALHKAINNYHIKGMDKIVDLLLSNKVDVNIQTIREGETALYMAATIGDVTLCRKLLEHRANPELKTREYLMKYDYMDADGIKMPPRTAYEIFKEWHPKKIAKYKAIEEEVFEKEHKEQRGEKRKAEQLKSHEQENSAFNNEKGSRAAKLESAKDPTKRYKNHVDDIKNTNIPKNNWQTYISSTNNKLKQIS